MYKTKIDSQAQKTNLWSPNRKWERDQLGIWDEQIHTTVYKIDKQQGPTGQLRELYSVSCDDMSWKRI